MQILNITWIFVLTLKWSFRTKIVIWNFILIPLFLNHRNYNSAIKRTKIHFILKKKGHYSEHGCYFFLGDAPWSICVIHLWLKKLVRKISSRLLYFLTISKIKVILRIHDFYSMSVKFVKLIQKFYLTWYQSFNRFC